MRRAAAAVLLILAAACNRPDPPPPQKPVQPQAPAAGDVQVNADPDVDNLLNIAYGASVVSRTAESNLEVSALHAIDGLSGTYWSSPPGDPRQTLVYSFPSRSRIERLGITTFESSSPHKVRFDASPDGRHWHEVALQSFEAADVPQIQDVKPFEASYLRVEILEPDSGYVLMSSVHAIGREIKPPARRNFEGCWTINGLATRVVQDGARLTGVMASDPPAFLDGGTDGRVAMFTWTRAPNHGFATLAMDTGTQTISGLLMYDDIAPENTAAAWIGERCADAPLQPISASSPSKPEERWAMYGLAFDDKEQVLEGLSRSTLDEAAERIRSSPGERFRVVAHEFRSDAPGRRTAARIASLRTALERRGADLSRVEFVAAGTRWTSPPIVAAIQRLLASRVDLERLPTP
jgi:hypothetical protein